MQLPLWKKSKAFKPSATGITPPLTREKAEELIVAGNYSTAVVFPEDFSDQILTAATDTSSSDAVVTLYCRPPAPSTQLLATHPWIRLEGFIREQAAYAQMPLRLQAGFDQIAAAAPARAGAVCEPGRHIIPGKFIWG